MTVEQLRENEIKQLHKDLDALTIKTNDDVRSFVTKLTKLVYDEKMIGLIYDYYAEDCEYHKQDDTVFESVHDIVKNVAELCAAFPNLRTHIESIIVYKVDANFYKASRRLHYWGNNYGPSKYGPPTGKTLANNCQNMSIMHIKKSDGKWKIAFELNSDSQDWMREVMTMDSAPAAEVAAQPAPAEAECCCCEEPAAEEAACEQA